MRVVFSVVIVVFLAAGMASCGGSQEAKDGVKITGTIEQVVPEGKVILQKIEETGPVPVDTAFVNSDGTYEMTVAIDGPSFFRLAINQRQIITLVLTGEETEVEVNAEGTTAAGYSEVSGSYDTQHMRDMDELMKAFQTDVQQLNQRAMQARTEGDIEAFQLVNIEYQEMAKKNNEKLKELVWNAVPSLAAFYGIQRLDPDQYFTFYDSVASELTKEIPGNPIVENLASTVEARRNLAVGAIAPEISLKNPDGEIISLSSLRGTYVLVDFWAAWCKPCRAENPNIVRAYNKYKGENFEVLQVSLDRTREAWLAAIEQDGLPWLHISDLKYWNSEVTKPYQLNAIPASYLIDPDGKIVGKNLRGPLLEAKLKEIFG